MVGVPMLPLDFPSDGIALDKAYGWIRKEMREKVKVAHKQQSNGNDMSYLSSFRSNTFKIK